MTHLDMMSHLCFLQHSLNDSSFTSHNDPFWSKGTAQSSVQGAFDTSQPLDGADSTHKISLEFEHTGPQGSRIDRNQTSDGLGLHNDQHRVAAKKQTVGRLCHKPMLKRVLPRHLRTVHSRPLEDRTYHCTVCDRSFARRDILDRHQAEQHGDRSPLVECIACGSYIRERALDEHYKTRKCQKMQHRNDILEVTDLTDFNIGSTVDPYLAAAISNVKQFRFLELRGSAANSDFADFLHFRGIALRAVFRALKAPSRSESAALCLALYALMVPRRAATGFSDGYPSEDQNKILAGAINTLQRRFYGLIERNMWGGDGIVSKIEAQCFPLHSELRHARLFVKHEWPDVLRPRIIALGHFQWVDGEIAYHEMFGDSLYKF